MQTIRTFFGGAFFFGEFFSQTPNVGGGMVRDGDYARAFLRGRRRTSTDVLLDRRRFGLDSELEALLTRWGRPKRKE